MLFRDLKAYQHALRVAALSRPLIKRLPTVEHDLADQWRRASNSIALNLAEGITRKGSKGSDGSPIWLADRCMKWKRSSILFSTSGSFSQPI